eukprot:6198975-Pleurochrysis_carterae.AAC.2
MYSHELARKLSVLVVLGALAEILQFALYSSLLGNCSFSDAFAARRARSAHAFSPSPFRPHDVFAFSRPCSCFEEWYFLFGSNFFANETVN